MFSISRTRLLAGAATLALTATLGATPGIAQETATMDVSATVAQDCSLTVQGPLAFGDIVPGDEGSASSSFTVDCASGGEVNIEISDGGHHDGSNRRMITETTAGDDAFLPYLLNDADSVAWNGPRTESVGVDAIQFVVNGIVSGSDTGGAALGEYTDQVTISLTFNGS